MTATVAPTQAKVDSKPSYFDVLRLGGRGKWHGLENYRCKRNDSIPSWFDRWDFYQGITKHPQSISSTVDVSVKTRLRRQTIGGVALHLSVVTCLVGLLVCVPTIASSLRATSIGAYQGHSERLLLLGGSGLELLVLKLVFDTPRLRSMVFAAYTATISLLFASTTVAFHGPYAVLCLALITCDWWLRWWLCGVRTHGGFLRDVNVAVIPFVLVTGVLIWLLANVSDGNSQRTLTLGLVAELAHAVLATIDVSLLVDTLPSEEAPLGVYFLNLDLLTGGVFVPLQYSGYTIITAVTTVVRCLWRALVWIVWMPWWLCECMSLTSSAAMDMQP